MKTIGSTSILPSELERVRRLLVAFTEGTVSLIELRQGLHGYLVVNFDGAPAQREIGHGQPILNESFRVPIERRHLRQMLEQHVIGQISKSELSDWAAFIFMSELFTDASDSQGDSPSSIDELLWDILQQLTTPAVFGGLDSTTAHRYLEELVDQRL